MTGRFVLDTDTPARPVSSFSANLIPREGPFAEFLRHADRMVAELTTGRQFEIRDVPPGRYLIDTLHSEDLRWTLVSAMTGGRDAADESFAVAADADIADLVITLTDRPTELRGSIVDANGARTADALVIVFSADPRYWSQPSRRVRTLHTDTSGTYVLRGLPSADYLIAALKKVGPNAWADPAWLRDLSRQAIRVRVNQRVVTAPDVRVR